MMTSTQEGMVLMESSLVDLISSGTISYDDAMGTTARPKELVRQLEQRGVVAAAV
jgi:Tfp pilus assembly pilus retraction ATPase PilT